MYRAFWITVCLVSALFAGYIAFINPWSFLEVSGIFTSVLSVLVGVSLAIVAVLSTPFQANAGPNQSRDFERRLNKAIEIEEVKLSIGQLIIFYSILFALALIILFNWLAVFYSDLPATSMIKSLSAVTATSSVFSLFLSARLPYLLFAVSKQRRELS